MNQPPTSTASAHAQADSTTKRYWGWLKTALRFAFFLLVAALLFMLVKIEWEDVTHALLNYRAETLLIGAAIAFTSYIVFASYDLIGRSYTGHRLPTHHILALAFVCYAFTLNLSAWVGGIALRFRLYSRFGLDTPTITKILSMSLITNWLGYIILVGVLLTFRRLELPGQIDIGTSLLQTIGILLLLVAFIYFCACHFSTRRSFHVRQQEFSLPSVKLAFAQAGLAIINWMLMGLLIFTLLPDKVTYPVILGILLISSIAGVITHIPAGLGVLEAIFLSMLQHQLSQGSILAALIGYRILYFLVPLGIACVMYLVIEASAKRLQSGDAKDEKKDLPRTE